MNLAIDLCDCLIKVILFLLAAALSFIKSTNSVKMMFIALIKPA